MKTITVEDAKKQLDRLLSEAASSHEPIQIQGEDTGGILLAESDWRSIQETLYLLSIPGMRESIRDGLETSIDECSEEPGW